MSLMRLCRGIGVAKCIGHLGKQITEASISLSIDYSMTKINGNFIRINPNNDYRFHRVNSRIKTRFECGASERSSQFFLIAVPFIINVIKLFAQYRPTYR